MGLNVKKKRLYRINVLFANYEINHKSCYFELYQMMQFESVCSHRFPHTLIWIFIVIDLH